MNFKNTTLVCITTLASAGPIIKYKKQADPDAHPEDVFPLVKATVKVYGDIQFNQFSNNIGNHLPVANCRPCNDEK